MEMLSENVWTIIITVVSGVLVYIIGEILQTVWLAPLQKFKSIKHDVSVALTYYAKIIVVGQGQLIDSEVVYFKKKLKSVFVRADIRTKGCRYVETVYNNEQWQNIQKQVDELR